jgi:hypothetical protein
MRKGIGTGLLGIGLLALTGFCLWTVAEPRQTRPQTVELWVPPESAAPAAVPPPVPTTPAPPAPTAPAEAPSTAGSSMPAPPMAEAPPPAAAPSPPEAAPAPAPPVAAPPAPPKQDAAVPPSAIAPAPAAKPAAPPSGLSPAELAAARRKVDALARQLAKPKPAVSAPAPAPAPASPPADGGFDAVLRSVQGLKRQQLASAGEVDPAPAPAPAPPVAPVELVRRQLLPCWERRGGPRVPNAPSVRMRLQLDPDGRVVRTETVDRTRLEDPLYRAIATSAVRAILECQPVTPPPGPPASWAVLTMTFVP